MKKHLLKSIFAALLVASLAFSMTACGGDKDPAAGADSGDVAPVALSEEDYMAKFEELGTKMNDLQTSASTLDPTDVEAAGKLLEDMKAPFTEFIDVVPPEKYGEAHVKFQSGCQSMIDYIDAAKSLMTETDATKQQETTKTLTDSLTAAMTDLAAGAELATAADQT